MSQLTSHEVARAVALDGEQRSKLVAYARARFGLAPEDAEDLLQETALELLRQNTIVRSPLGFTFRVFHRRCCRFIRMRQADRQVFVPVENPVETACAAAAPETADRQLTLRRVLETISSPCRRILLAYYMEGRSLKETAEAMLTPYPGVWNTINRCLRRLRACLA